MYESIAVASWLAASSAEFSFEKIAFKESASVSFTSGIFIPPLILLEFLLTVSEPKKALQESDGRES